MDGQELQGRYYPAAVNPAPVIVLMHWANGDQDDWVEVGYWLQNRGLGGKSAKDYPWLDPSWFPALAEGESYAVFTFNFRGCKGGCNLYSPEPWLLDAEAAMKAVIALEGVDPTRVLVAGASIGADGAADGCMFLNAKSGTNGKCLGAFSFSPGDYLTLPFAAVVNEVEAMTPPAAVYCLYGEDDNPSAKICKSAKGNLYQKFGWKGNDHGMMLIRPDMEPLSLQIFLDFIRDRFRR